MDDESDVLMQRSFNYLRVVSVTLPPLSTVLLRGFFKNKFHDRTCGNTLIHYTKLLTPMQRDYLLGIRSFILF